MEQSIQLAQRYADDRPLVLAVQSVCARIGALVLSVASIWSGPFPGGASCQASGFHASGTVTLSFYTNGQFVPETMWAFSASVVGEKWLVIATKRNGQKSLHGSDGDSVYYCLIDEKAARRMHANAYPGDVFDGNYPVQAAGMYTALPWLAFCSGSYINARQTNGYIDLPAPWLPAFAMPLAHIYRVSYSGISGGHGLPEHLAFVPSPERIRELRAGIYRSLTGPSVRDRDRFLIALGRYDGIGEAEGEYRVTRVTKVGEISVPAEFTFDRFTFRRGPKGAAERVPTERYEGITDSLATIETLDPIPRVDGAVKDISVADYRFYDEKQRVVFVNYRATNSLWLTNRSDPVLQKRLAEVIKGAQKLDAGPRLSAPIVLLLLLMVIASPLAFKPVRQVVFKPFINRKNIARP